MEGTPVITFSNVTFGFPGKPVLFEAASLNLSPASLYVLHGPSGSGKSTLLRLMVRLEEPAEGVVSFKGRPLPDYSPPELRRNIHYFQQNPTLVDASVRENLLLPFSFQRNRDMDRPGDDVLEAMLAEFLLQDVKLTDNALNLSGGQKQRLCFIRALLLQPDALLLDEPNSSLDAESGLVVEQAAEKAAAAGLTVVMITHRPFHPENVRVADLDLRDRRVVERR